MFLKKRKTNSLAFKRAFEIVKQRKFFFGAILISLYSVMLLGLGYTLQRHDFYGLFLKPVFLKNYRIIGDYIDSYAADPEKISLDIKHMDYLKLAYQRQQGLELGKLPYSLDEGWVPATIKHRGNTIRVNIRLKGAEEHWKDENQWSFKVKIKGNNTMFGMKNFELQSPKTRTFLNEWHWNKLLHYSGLIYLRYDFIDLTVNGNHMPTYAIEENFEKRMIENNQLRDGPIFRAGLHSRTTLQATHVYQYKQRKQDIKFLKLIKLAESRIEAFRQGEISFSKTFDVDKMSKLFALSDLVGSRHHLDLGNLRFYYNPITGLIEPIGADASITLSRVPKFNFIGEGWRYFDKQNVNIDWRWPFVAFRDKIFFKKYIEYLEAISDKNFLDRFFSETEEEKQEKTRILNRSFPYYESDLTEKVYKNSDYIKKYLQPTKALNVYFNGVSVKSRILSLDVANIHNFPVEILGIAFVDDAVPVRGGFRSSLKWNQGKAIGTQNFKIKTKDYNEEKLATDIFKPFHETILQAKRRKGIYRDVDSQKPTLVNMKEAVLKEVKVLANLLPMISTSLKEENVNKKYQDEEIFKLEYKNVNFRFPRELKWSDELLPKLRVISRIFGARLKTSNEVTPWARHEEWFDRPANVQEVPFMLVEEETKLIKIKQGKWSVDQDIIIPPGYRVVAGEGTHLVLKNGAKILSYSAFDFSGSEEKPIIISSKGQSGQGIVIMKAKDKSIIRHTIFDGLSSPNQGGWALTGAVTLYESAVVLSDSQFMNNRSEDALNIVRSDFTLENLVFKNILADAFDSDFSVGSIKQISFINCGNDGLDVSGGEVQVESILFDGIGDKGLSAGEKSRVLIDKLIGKNSRIAVASKDQSEVFINEAKIESSQIGFAVFQKKPEFGPASIKVNKLEKFSIKTPFIVEEGSHLLIEGISVLPRAKNIKKFLYGENFQDLEGFRN
jgi:spore coat protein CotH